MEKGWSRKNGWIRGENGCRCADAVEMVADEKKGEWLELEKKDEQHHQKKI